MSSETLQGFVHAAEILPQDPLARIPYPDGWIQGLLEQVKTIALVGISAKTDRPSFVVMNFLQSQGYRVLPVNPGLAGQTLLGETVYATLSDVPVPVDMVDIFRNSDAAAAVVDEALARNSSVPSDQRIRVIWMQLGVRHDDAARHAEAAGLSVVMNRCPKIELQG